MSYLATSDRFPSDVETAAYFVACEGLTNAVKHARAGEVRLEVARHDSTLVVSVADNGVGGAAVRRGSGLTGLSDRVAARGGGTADRQRPRPRDHPQCGAAVRVVIAEDQVLLREGLARLFVDGGHEVVATVGDGDAVVEVVDREIPDLVVVDIRMPPTYTDEGARAARAIKDQHPRVGVLVLSQHIETTHAVDLVGRPGFGYLLKDRVLEVDEFLATAAGSPRAAQHSTRRSSEHWCTRRPAVRWPGSPSASAACSS